MDKFAASHTAAGLSCSYEQLTMSPGALLQQSREVLQRRIVCWDHSAPMGWTGTCSTISRDADTAVGKLVVQLDDSQFTECHRQQQQTVSDSRCNVGVPQCNELS